MSIPFVDLKAQYRAIKKEIDKTVSGVIEGARFIQGPEVSLFETAFAKYLRVAHCIGVNSGTDALILGIRALELAPGDEVIVPVHTFIATALGVSENRLKPVFVDMDKDDYGMDLSDLKKKITPRTKAIIAVHLYGRPEKIDEIAQLIKNTGRKIHLIEDACQAHGAFYKGKKVGGFGIFSAFSFYPGKNLGAYGDAGAIVTNDAQIAQKFRKLREYGQKEKYYHDSLGTNTRLDTLQAAVLCVKLKHLDAWNSKRQKLAAYYTQQIKKHTPQLRLSIDLDRRQSVFHLFVVEAQKRDSLLAHLNKKGVQALIHYPVPLHLQKAYASLGYKKGDFPNAEEIAGRIISLPIYPELTKKQVDFIIHTIKEFYDR